MKRYFAGTISAASLSLALFCAGQALAQTPHNENTQQTAENAKSSTNQAEANGMVRAVVALTHSLDAKKAQPGSQFETKLESTVHLNNGTDLPKGSTIMGQVANDDMNQNGTSKLAVRFTEAKQKDGKTVPIRATIVEVYPPREFNGYGSPEVDTGAPAPLSGENAWNAHTLKVDQVGAINGADLHSSVNSQNSGVFVNNKNDVKLNTGSQLALAISADTGSNQGPSGTGGSR
jgi:hypothetical protein